MIKINRDIKLIDGGKYIPNHQRVFCNQFEGSVFAGDGVCLGDAYNNSYITIPIPQSAFCGVFYSKDDGGFKKVDLQGLNEYVLQESFSNFVILDVECTDDDLTYLNSKQESLFDIFTQRLEHPNLSFNLLNFLAYYPAIEQGGLVYDVMNPPVSMKFKLTVENDGDEVTIPLDDAYCTIDWGDGTNELFVGSDAKHIYDVAGDYNIEIRGKVGACGFGGSSIEKVYEMLEGGETAITTCYRMFANYDKDSMTLGVFDTGNVTSMRGMFYYMNNITTPPDVSNFNTANVTDMDAMFYYMNNITTPPDVSNFNTANVGNMREMFYVMTKITTPPDTSNFNTANVTTMRGMFNNMSSVTTPPDVSNFDTGNVTDMYDMFYNMNSATTPPDVSNFDTGNVSNMGRMFYNMSSITTPPDVSNFNTANVTDMHDMFLSMSNITTPPDVSNFDTGNVINMSRMFYGIDNLDGCGAENFNIQSLTDASDFITGELPTDQYDTLLVNWYNQPHNNDVSVSFGSSKYTAGSDAETARQGLIDDGWTITDGGSV